MNDYLPLAVRAFAAGLGATLGYFIIRWIYELIQSKRQGQIDSLDLTFKKIELGNSKLSDDDIVKHANDRDSTDSSIIEANKRK